MANCTLLLWMSQPTYCNNFSEFILCKLFLHVLQTHLSSPTHCCPSMREGVQPSPPLSLSPSFSLCLSPFPGSSVCSSGYQWLWVYLHVYGLYNELQLGSVKTQKRYKKAQKYVFNLIQYDAATTINTASTTLHESKFSFLVSNNTKWWGLQPLLTDI